MKSYWESNKEDIKQGNSLKQRFCAHCHEEALFDNEKQEFILTKYCPHCGAEMFKSFSEVVSYIQKEVASFLKCSYFKEEIYIDSWGADGSLILRQKTVCNGTKEREICTCGGDIKKCNFYTFERTKKESSLSD